MNRYSFKFCSLCVCQDSFSWFYQYSFGGFRATTPTCRVPLWSFCSLPPIRNLLLSLSLISDLLQRDFPHLPSCSHCFIHSMDRPVLGEPSCWPLHDFYSCCCCVCAFEYWGGGVLTASSIQPCLWWCAGDVSFLVTCGRSRRGVATRTRSIGPRCFSAGNRNLAPPSCSWFNC